MNRLKLYAGCAFAVLILALTNPSQEDFVAWVKDKAHEKTGDNPGARFLTDLLASPLVAATTQRSNWLICSIYDTQLSPGKHKRTLGVLRFFIPLGQDRDDQG
ncbi:MAG TPA: hypothetical protein VKP60_05580 [Magnetospirillaceae bacterium]|nr:hypothetical protein [Magnetospirillaceae bacterium]